MKILQINAWGGRIKDGLTRFISEGNYDVVCMQEAVWDKKQTSFLEQFIDTVDKIKREASFKFIFRSEHYGFSVLNDDVQYRCGIVIMSKIPFSETEERIILEPTNQATKGLDFEKIASNHRYTAQKVILENGVAIVNYHGYWQKDSLGNKDSTECMRAVVEMFKDIGNQVVMCGDLNLVSEAPAMRELDFLTDLTAKNKVKTTLRNIRFVKDVACDHILVGNDIAYDDFEVINAPVSDHMALTVDIKA